jgi:hypothetical protein
MKNKVQEEYPEFANEISFLDLPSLRARIVSLQQALAESEEHREANDSLKEARAVVSEISGPYNDVKKAVKLKTKYILDLIKEKGE